MLKSVYSVLAHFNKNLALFFSSASIFLLYLYNSDDSHQSNTTTSGHRYSAGHNTHTVMKQLIEVLNYIKEYNIGETKIKLEYFAEAEAIEIRFKSKFQKKYSPDFIQINTYGINYWNDYQSNYVSVSVEEIKTIIYTSLI